MNRGESLHPASGMAVELEGITKRYGTVTALRDITFAVPAGQTLGLLGRNGAGKTTALNVMTGYFPPNAGTVRIGGIDLLADPRECKRRIGYLPERPPLYDEMTVTEYLLFVSELRETLPRSRRQHVGEIMERCGLQKVRDRLLGQLSRGYRQRAGIAQALCGNPELLILDEPTVGLDPRQTADMRELIRALGEDHTVIFSSHLLTEVQQLCTRVIILREGRIAGDLSLDADGIRAPRLRLTVAGRSPQTVQAIARLEGISRAEELAGSAPGETDLLLRREDAAAAEAVKDRIFRCLAQLNVPIRELREEPEPLEEIFLRMTEEEENTQDN